MNFTIEQILNLSQQGFSVDQIKAFDSAYKTQPTQAQPVQQYAQPMQTPPVQQYAQPVQKSASMSTDTSMQMLNLVKAMQEQALAEVSGHTQKPETAVDASLDILGRGGKN